MMADDWQDRLLESDPELHHAINNALLSLIVPLDLILTGLAWILHQGGRQHTYGLLPPEEPPVQD